MKDLLRPNLERRVPDLATVTEFPLPTVPTEAARASAEQLIASDLGATAV